MRLTIYEPKNNRQTRERGENHLHDSDCPNMLPGQDPELPPKEGTFYNKVLVCSKSELSRRKLESLPGPFDTYYIMNGQMEQIVFETETETHDRLRFDDNRSIDFNNDRHGEVQWGEMEKTVVRYGISHYEDE